MRIIDLAQKDLLQIVRDWRAALFLIIMPIAFTLLFGFAFGGFGGVEEDPRLPVLLHSADDGLTGELLISLLDNSQIIRIEQTEEDEKEKLRESITNNDAAAAVIIPEGYSSQLDSGTAVPVIVISNSGDVVGQAVQGEIQTAVTRLTSSVRSARYGTNLYNERFGFGSPDEQQEYLEASLTDAVDSWKNPPVNVVVTSTSADGSGEQGESENAFAQSSTGMIGQFAIFGLIGAASILVLEKKNRVLQRLVTSPISKPEILIGHFLAMFTMIIGQLIILILFGQLLLDLNYLSSPLATAMLVIATSFFAASLGLLIGAVSNTQEQVIVFSLIPMFLLAGFGGAWVPLEITPEGFQQLAKFTPLAWVVEGFKDIIVRGQGIEAVAPSLLALLAYSVVLLVVAIWRFRFE